MLKFFPTSSFKWIDPKELALNKYNSNSSKRCIAELDLEYPLLLFDKEKYVLHYEKFAFYLKLRLKLEKVHRILEFSRSQWLKPYTEFNTHKKIEAE